MGRPKALLPCLPAAETFTARIVRSLRAGGVSDVVVVGRDADDDLRTHVAGLEPATAFVVNPDPSRGQLSSVLVAVEYAAHRSAEAILVMPVDIPRVRPDTIAAALAAFIRRDAPIVRMMHRGRHGHPVIFRATLFDALRAADPSIGAKAVVRAYADQVLNVEVDDPGVLHDVDVPEDYERLFGGT